MEFENDNIKLKDFKKKNVTKKYLSWLRNKKLMKYSRHSKKLITKNDALKFLKFMKKNNNLFLSIYEKKYKKNIGTITAYINKDLSVANIGVLIGDSQFVSKKIGYQSCKLMIEYLLKIRKVKKIVIGSLSKNIAMIKICKKLNMRLFYQKKIDKKLRVLRYCITS
jgi:RimJ/RimL family protein N-acetyltransferase